MFDNEHCVVVAPFANERVREWPVDQFRRFIALAIKDGMPVKVMGTSQQRVRANAFVRGFPATAVENTCGRMSWADVLETIRSSAYVVANNSGLAHAAASMNVWTLCLFAGSHSWREWMPIGPRVVTASRMVQCAPCEIGFGRCPNDAVCLGWLDAEVVYHEFNAKRLEARSSVSREAV